MENSGEKIDNSCIWLGGMGGMGGGKVVGPISFLSVLTKIESPKIEVKTWEKMFGNILDKIAQANVLFFKTLWSFYSLLLLSFYWLDSFTMKDDMCHYFMHFQNVTCYYCVHASIWRSNFYNILYIYRYIRYQDFFLRYLQPMEFAPDDSSFIIKSRHHFLKKDEDTK